MKQVTSPFGKEIQSVGNDRWSPEGKGGRVLNATGPTSEEREWKTTSTVKQGKERLEWRELMPTDEIRAYA